MSETGERRHTGPLTLETMLRRARWLLPQLSRYTIVSGVALLADLVTLMTLRGLGARAALAGVAGYCTGLILHYVLSSRFVFQSERGSKSQARLFGEFAVSGLIGLALTAAILHVATDIAGLPALVGKLIAVGVSFFAVFVMRKTIVFADRRAA